MFLINNHHEEEMKYKMIPSIDMMKNIKEKIDSYVEDEWWRRRKIKFRERSMIRIISY